jgi:hypothetical protein
MGDKMENRRKLKRRHLIYYLKVFEVSSGRLFGHLVDITIEGCMLISKDPKEANRTFDLRMVLPSDIQGKNEVFFQARAVWCAMDINPEYHASGFQFINISMEDVLIIEQLINRFGFQD